MKTLKAALTATAILTGALAQAQEPLDIMFTTHSSSANAFWQTVQKGFEDACARIGANCQMIYIQSDGGLEAQVTNMEAALARQPDALITSIVDNNLFDDVIRRARDAGVTVIATNVDDLEGAAGNARQAFVGQGIVPAGYTLAEALWASLPAEGPVHLLVGINAPGQNWSEQRALGVINYIEEQIAANPDRGITYERIDAGTDMAVVTDRIGAYLAANPNTNAYFDTGIWHAGVARLLADRGIPPGQVLLAGFDVIPDILDQMKLGCIQVAVDQQPCAQGFIPVMQAYLAATAGLRPSDYDTGRGLVMPAMVDQIMALSKQGLR